MYGLDFRNWSLTVKITLSITLTVVLAVLSVTLISLNRERSSFRSELEQQAKLLLELLEEVSADALYTLDADFIQEIVQELQESDTLLAGRVYDADGRVIADSTAEGELLFSFDPDPVGAALVASDSTTYEWQSDRLLAGQAVTAGNQRLGAVSIELLTQPLDDKIAEVRNRGLIVALVTIIAGTLLALVLSQSINEPLRELVAASQRIATGDLTQRIPVTGMESRSVGTANADAARNATGNGKPQPASPSPVPRNEIAQLAVAFNEMADAVARRETDLREQAETLRIAKDQAQEASRIKSEFLANVSHELRTPLNVIIGFSDMLLMGMDGELEEKQRHKVERLRENGNRLLTLINDILDLSRLEAKRLELVRKPFSPADLAQQLVEQHRVLADQKKLTFKVEIADDLPSSLVGDEKRIEQIAVNLLSNAIKFTEEGTVTLKVVAQPDQKRWLLQVVDTGVGIPPHALDTIFEEFRQVDGSSTRKYAGSGLGLAITRNLVRLMQGEITVQSTLGTGSTFTVTLPMVVEETPQGEQQP